MTDKIKILYVDDNALDRELVRDALEKEHSGFMLTEAATRDQFEEIIKTGQFDLVLSDFNILGFEGLDVIKAVQKIDPQIPVVIVTGTGSEEIAVKSMQQGASDYVIKRPSHIQRLPQTIISAIEKKKMKDDRKIAEHSRDEALQRLELALRSSNVGLWDWDLKSETLFFSKEWKNQLGYADEELEATYDAWKSRLHPDDRASTIKSLRRYLDGESPKYDLEFRLRHRDKSYRWIHARGEMIRDEKNVPSRILGCHVDITKNKILEQKLLQYQKTEAIGTLAGGIAHDFNNILSSIIGFTELAMDDVEKETPVFHHLVETLASGMRARDLIRQILIFSKQTKPEFKPIQINSVITEALNMLKATIPASIDIRCSTSEQRLIVNGDATQIHQVIVNLFTNAWHAISANGGIISIDVNPTTLDEHAITHYPGLEPGQYVKITVSDNGNGIASEHLDFIFDPYFSTKTPERGTGLGLAVVAGIIKSHQGHISVYSEVKKGTTFCVHLPQSEKQSAKDLPKNSDKLPSGTESVLFIDDEPSITKMQKQQLERLGYTVTALNDSEAAIAAFRAEPDRYALVITDMTMPKMTGDRVAAAVKEIRPQTPVILCTGFSERVNIHKAAKLKIDAFLMKPVDKAVMAKTIRQILDGNDN
ncbi:MAG: response regulator [Desulfobacteraceae bacterium]|jgi:PAS domain S-box-containing protein|nr:response regulator [Desulfobacteraceae bacterium]